MLAYKLLVSNPGDVSWACFIFYFKLTWIILTSWNRALLVKRAQQWAQEAALGGAVRARASPPPPSQKRLRRPRLSNSKAWRMAPALPLSSVPIRPPGIQQNLLLSLEEEFYFSIKKLVLTTYRLRLSDKTFPFPSHVSLGSKSHWLLYEKAGKRH